MTVTWAIPATGKQRYLLLAALLVVGYAVVAGLLFARQDFADRGPLSRPLPGEVAPAVPADLPSPEQAIGRCFPERDDNTYRYEAIPGQVNGRWLYGCYRIYRASGEVWDLKVLDPLAGEVSDVATYKAAGVWPWFAEVPDGRGLLFGGIAMLGVVTVLGRYYALPRPGPPRLPPTYRRRWWQRRAVAWSLVLLPGASWLWLWGSRCISRARKIRIWFQAVFIVAVWWIAVDLIGSASVGDLWGGWVYGSLAAAVLLGHLGGTRWLAPADFDNPDGTIRRWAPVPAPREEPDFDLSLPAATDVALRQFRSAAQARALASTTIRGVAIGTAAALIVLMLMFGGLIAALPDISSVVLALIICVIIYAMFFVVPGATAALLGLPLILGWRNPARVLVLRPFNRADGSRPLRTMIRREVAGYGHVYTLADASIRVRWYATMPALVGQLGLLSFRMRRVGVPRDIRSLATTVQQTRLRNLNWLVARSKVFAVRSVDGLWQQAVQLMVERSDAVLVDVTEMSTNLAWELDLLCRLGRLDDCIFLARYGTEQHAAGVLAEQLRQEVRLLGFEQTGRHAVPQQFRLALAAILFRNT